MIPAALLQSHAAQAWLCRLSTGFAAGADLVRFLVDDRGPGGLQRYEGEPDADRLLTHWLEEHVIVLGELQPLTPEQQINSRGSARLANHYGYRPGPAFVAPAWIDPPRRDARPSWQRAIDEHNALPRGTRDADGFLLVPCPGGGPVSSVVPAYYRRGREGYCSACSGWYPVREDGRLPKHLTADLLAPVEAP